MRVILVVVFIGAACAVPRNPVRIVGGESTTIENYPFMALTIFNVRFPLCGGTLITNTAVLSAAHCYVNDPPSIWRVRLGSTFRSSGGIEHLVSKINSHANYTSGLLLNDVAVLKLTNPAVFSDKINTARIAGPNYILPDNTPVHAIGWGVTRWIFADVSEVLRHVEIDIINHQICTERYAFLKSLPWISHMADVTPEMLCTGILNEGGKDACQGDSGGPIIHNRDIVVGIISWGHRCAQRLYPGVNTRVSSYSNWIYTNSLDD